MAFLVRNQIKGFLSATNCQNCLLALGGSTNFRNDLKLPCQYKGSRKDVIKPLALYEVRDYLKQNFKCVISIDEEADDIDVCDVFKNGVCETSDKDAVFTFKCSQS